MSDVSEERLAHLFDREGLRTEEYKDSLGKGTIGIGHLITKDERKSGKIYDIDFSKGITKEQAHDINKRDVASHDTRTDASLSKHGIENLSDTQRDAVRNAAFQLGPDWLDEHKKTRKMLQDGDFDGVAKEVENSKWFKQTPKRVVDFQKGITAKQDVSISDQINFFMSPEIAPIEVPLLENTPLDIEASKEKEEPAREPSRAPAFIGKIEEDLDSVTDGTVKEEAPDLPKVNEWGAKVREQQSLINDLKEFTTKGMGNDLVNKFVDRNAVGFLTQAAIRGMENTGTLDEEFNAFEDPIFKEFTKDLDNKQLEEVLKHTNNRGDFINNVSMMLGENKRKKEMTDYTNDHPVLSGVTTVTNIVGEAASFMPVASIIGAASASTKIKAISELTKASRYKQAIFGELVENTLQEVIWAKHNRDYTFDPVMFASALGLGVGLKMTYGTPQADEAFRAFLKDEGGFINISVLEGKKLVDEVASKVSDKQAIALAQKVTGRKTAVANSLRKNMAARRSSLMRQIKQTSDAIAANTDKGLTKKLKGKHQKLTRSLVKFDKNLPSQLEALVNGTHPKLTAAVNPLFSIKNIAEEIGIDPSKVSSISKTRKFLGLDQPNVDPNFIFEGEKAYENVARKQLKEMDGNRRLNMNESLRYAAGTDTVKNFDKLPVLGKLQIGDKLNSLSNTDGPITRFLFNKGNLVSSDNELISSYYNWMAPDGMGRQGMSNMRAIESQQKYASIYGGDLMTIYHAHGNDLYEAIKGKGVGTRVKGFLSPDDYERTVEPLLRERLLLGSEAFKSKYGEQVAKIGDDFATDFNKLNKKIVDRAKELKVEGVNFDATDDWFHRSWDFRKARGVDNVDLQDGVFRAMKSHAEKLGVEITDEALKINARKFSFGIQSADMTVIEGLQTDHIKLLSKLADKADGAEVKVIRSEIERLKILKAKADAGDLANRVQMDVNVKLKDGRPLADLFEDNFVHTQKRYTSRMSGRIAAAEHGIRNIDDVQEWINDAVELEMKRLAAKGVENPKEAVSHVKKAMEQDFMSFKNGGMVGIHDLPDDTASDFIRLVKKYNFARLMQYTGISSIAEMGGTFVEAGVGNTLRTMSDTFRQHFNDLYIDNPAQYSNRLYDELRSITGVGMEDFAFTSKGLSKAGRITDVGIANQLEKGIDSIGRLTQGTFGGIETVGRRVTANALATKWANHFTGIEEGGLLSAFFGSNGFSNRVLENSGFGSVDNLGKFTPNKVYKDIQESMKKFASYDENGRLVKLNLEKWNSSTAHSFGDAIQMQSNHIMVNPDATTMALWQSTTVGQILNQFRTFTVNATTKVAGAALSNAAISAKRGDQSEMIKGAQKIFWGTSLGMLSVALRQGIQRAGGDREVDLFDDGLIKAAAIGFSRSSVAGNIPTIADSISGAFGVDPLFEKTSSVGRSKNFFNLATTPTGQALGGIYQSTEKVLQGDFKGGAMKLLKTSPVYRQIGAQQIFNFAEKE